MLTTVGTAWAGNEDWKLLLNDAPANSIVMLMISTDSVWIPIPGAPLCTLYTQLPLLAADLQVSNGSGVAAFNLSPYTQKHGAPVGMRQRVNKNLSPLREEDAKQREKPQPAPISKTRRALTLRSL